jgi:antitoxin HicB
MKYPARLKLAADTGGYEVYFRDIPEAITCGDDLDDAIVMAKDALITAMDFYFEDHRPVPMPSQPKRGEKLIDLPPSITAKVLLLNEMLAQNKKQAELARELGLKPQEITRLVNLKHPTKIDRIAEALEKMGKSLELSIS